MESKRIVNVGDGFSKDEIKTIDTSKLLDSLVSDCAEYLKDTNQCIGLVYEENCSEIDSEIRDYIKLDYLSTIVRITDNGKTDYDIIDFMNEYKSLIKILEDSYEGYASIVEERLQNERYEEERSFDRDRL